MTIALFLLGGLLTIVQNTRSTFASQNLLSQLQDNERLAMTFIANVIESGGYYPNPQVNDPTNTLTTAVLPPFVNAIAGNFIAGQPFYGVHTASAPGDTITVRYAAANSENLFNCMGTQSTVAPYDTFVNKFWIKAGNQLTCTFIGKSTPATDIVLVNNVENLSIQYGITRNTGAPTGSCADTYLFANLMLPADWNAVCSVSVTLIFSRPNLNVPAGPGNQPTTLRRIIAVMNKAGVNT